MKGIHDRYNYHLDIIISNYEFIKANLIKKKKGTNSTMKWCLSMTIIY